MPNKIKKYKCAHHADNRDLSEYVFWHTDIRKSIHIDIYECIKCKDHLDKLIDRENRIREHNKIQEEKARIIREEKLNKLIHKRNKIREENIWDIEVKDELCKQLKLNGYNKCVYKSLIPKDVIRLKRASMKLDRLINQIKKGKKDDLEAKNIPLIKCGNHGDIFIDGVIKSGKNKFTGEQLYKCRKCMSDFHKNYYKRRKDYVLQKHAEYRILNPEKVKETRNKSWRKCNGKD